MHPSHSGAIPGLLENETQILEQVTATAQTAALTATLLPLTVTLLTLTSTLLISLMEAIRKKSLSVLIFFKRP